MFEMNSIVSMVRDSHEEGGRDLYSCSSNTWDLLLELGQAFGWQRHGTSYLRVRDSKTADTDVRHDYRPGDPRDSKQIDTSDAREWAAALTLAKDSPHLATLIGVRPVPIASSDEVTAEQAGSANAPFTAILEEFIAYASVGGFAFAIASRAGAGSQS
jgi:hypothetical protein